MAKGGTLFLFFLFSRYHGSGRSTGVVGVHAAKAWYYEIRDTG
jgi:hypothetical protein